MWDIVKQVISTRGLQLIVRYLGTALFSLATWCGATVSNEDGQKVTIVVSTIIVALICKGVDLFSHWLQAKNKELQIDQERELGRRIGVAEAKSPNVNRFIPLIAFLLIPFFAGCSTTDQMAASAGTAIAATLAHATFEVHVDPVSGAITADVVFKNARGEIIETRTLTAEQMEAQFLACNDQAQRNLKATFKQALHEMKDTQKRELAKLKAARNQCHSPQLTFTQPAPVELPPHIPEPGDIIVPATNDDGSFSIPGEKGLWKVAPPRCEIINGRRVCR